MYKCFGLFLIGFLLASSQRRLLMACWRWRQHEPGALHKRLLAVLTMTKRVRKMMYFEWMDRLDRCLPLYIGCETNKGQLVGIIGDRLFIQAPGKEPIVEYHKQVLGKSLFLYLQKIGDIADHQSNELIEKGFSIGRPSGYSFSNEAFLYLLGLQVDLFGMIKSGIAKDRNKL